MTTYTLMRAPLPKPDLYTRMTVCKLVMQKARNGIEYALACHHSGADRNDLGRLLSVLPFQSLRSYTAFQVSRDQTNWTQNINTFDAWRHLRQKMHDYEFSLRMSVQKETFRYFSK